MTGYARIRNTLLSNPSGIMDSTLTFGLQHRIKSNTRLYFYKYDIYDLVEVKFENEIICVYDFKHTEDKAVVIKDDLEFYDRYFKSAGLYNKRFLFDVTTKMPVSYDDFEEMETIPSPENKDFAFVLDRKTGYIAEKGAVSIFIATERTDTIDKCVLAYMNNSIQTLNPKHFELAGCMSSVVISGLLSELNFESIKKQYYSVDDNNKFIGSLNELNFNSEFVNSLKAKLKLNKFKRILEKSKPDNITQGEVIKLNININGEKVNLDGEVSLREIVDKGLDRFINKKNPKDVLKVCIDTEYQTIRSAYIVRGVMFITPTMLMPLNYFRELLNSDNVEYILN